MSTVKGPLIRLVLTVAHITLVHGRLFDLARLVSLRWTPHPVIMTIRHNRGYIRVLLYSYYTTITGWGVLLKYPQ